MVHVDEDHCGTDQLPISLTLSLPSVSHASTPKRKKWFEKSNWEKANGSVYLTTLASLLSTLCVTYHFLQLSTPCLNKKLDLNIYYLKIAYCLKQAEAVAVLFDPCHVNTRQPVWNIRPELKTIKNKAKFWLRIWVACGRPASGKVFDIKQSIKIAYKKHLRETYLNGKNFPKNKKNWKNVSNSSKFDGYNTQCNTSSSRWLSNSS